MRIKLVFHNITLDGKGLKLNIMQLKYLHTKPF